MKNKIFVTKPFLPQREEFDKYVDRIWETDQLTNRGPLHEEFADELKKYLKAPELTLTSNGHLALEIAIKGLGLSGEVITTPFTFASTTHSLALNGIKPVFCDITEDNMTIDTNRIEECITEKTTAILPVHTYGHMCDTEGISKIAEAYGLKVLYDAAHAFGVKKDGVSSGMYGDASIYSFHATKLFHTIEGGAIVYKNQEYRRLFEGYKNFGIENEECVSLIGGNAKMNEFQAAMGLANIPHLSEIISEREEITYRYHRNLEGVAGLRLYAPYEDKRIEHNFSYVPILIDEKYFGASRDQIYYALKKDNIFVRKYFYPLTCDFECYKGEFQNSDLPVARKISEQVLCLPIYNGLSLEVVDEICVRLLKLKG